MMMMAEGLGVTIAHADDGTRQALAAALDRRHRVLAECALVQQLHGAVAAQQPDLIVIGTGFADGNGIEAVIEIGEKLRPIPSVVVTAQRSLALVEKAMEDHVMAYLIEPVRAADLEPAILVAWSRFQQLRELESEVGELKQALEDRKVIERAKGAMMAAEGLSESEAYAKLRRMAQDQRTRIARVAADFLRELLH